MSVIEGSRKLLQDFVAPKLRAIEARLAALEKQFDVADKTEQERFAAADEVEKERFDRILAEIRQLHSVHDLELRVARIESQAGVRAAATPGSEAA